MGIGLSILLLAVGAILTFAVEIFVEGVDLDTVGVILMIVGAVGLAVTMLMWGGNRYYGKSEKVIYTDDDL